MRADSPDDVDRLSFHLPMFKEMGDQVQMEVTPLRSYAGLATDLKQRVDAGNDEIFEDTPTVSKAGLFYWITFNIEYPGEIAVSGVSVQLNLLGAGLFLSRLTLKGLLLL